MALLKNNTQSQFTVVAQNIFRDEKLSLRTLGLLCKLLSLPSNWNFSEAGLYAILNKDGMSSIKASVKELEEYGYLKRYQLKGEKGLFGNNVWEITMNPFQFSPLVDLPPTDKPLADKSIADNQLQYNTNIYNTNISSTNISSIKESFNKENKEIKENICVKEKKEKTTTTTRFIKPTLDELREYCKTNNYTIDINYFYDYYESKGWMIGKDKMQDWKATIRNWVRREHNNNPKSIKQEYKGSDF